MIAASACGSIDRSELSLKTSLMTGSMTAALPASAPGMAVAAHHAMHRVEVVAAIARRTIHAVDAAKQSVARNVVATWNAHDASPIRDAKRPAGGEKQATALAAAAARASLRRFIHRGAAANPVI